MCRGVAATSASRRSAGVDERYCCENWQMRCCCCSSCGFFLALGHACRNADQLHDAPSRSPGRWTRWELSEPSLVLIRLVLRRPALHAPCPSLHHCDAAWMSDWEGRASASSLR